MSELQKACLELQAKLRAVSVNYSDAWQKMAVISNSKKKELENYRKMKGFIK